MSAETRWPHLADAADILQWADRIEARTEFPRLVRTLIRQTNDQVVALEMRAAEGAESPGYDGVVEAARSTAFVPSGNSVWELGVGADPGEKANEDYKKRTNNPLHADPAETTFVFVTLRRWPDKQNWVASKKGDGIWRDVKAFDVDDVELALETAPAAHFWFSEVIGKPASSIQTIEDWWIRFSELSHPVLSPHYVLAGRQDQAGELLRVLDQDRRVTSVSAASTDDVLAFVASTLLTSREEVRVDLLARTLIVRDALSLRQLDSATGLFVLLPFQDELRREAQLVRSHHVILLAPEDVPADIVLPPIDRKAFAELLEGVVDEGERVRTLTNAAHRSLIAFQREAPARGMAFRPDWSTLFSSTVVRRAWLAGSWTERRSGDRDALEALLGVSYDEVGDELRNATLGPDPLFSLVGDSWAVVSPDQGWEFASSRMTIGDLSALEGVVQTVLGAVDPALELAVEDRWQADIYGKTRVHSSDLRGGLATTLALLGHGGDATSLGAGRTARGWAESVVFDLLRRANDDPTSQLWSSLSDVLPLLAEAAPDVFLRAVEEGAAGPEPVLSKVFTDQDGDGFSVSSPHTGLLWALEVVAWSKDHLGLAARLLARLTEIDPGGRLSNRPLGSLVDIFRPWLPQTAAAPEQRLDVLDGICEVHEEACWSLLMGLLPEHYLVGGYTYEPRFRNWKPEGDQGVLATEFWEFSAQVANRLIRLSGEDPERWVGLIERLGDFPPDQRSAALDRLEELGRNHDHR